jgi:hypothetical protein
MKPVNKERFLDKLENKVESHIQEAVRVFQNADEQTLLRPAPNGGWSIAQCLDHLNSYGNYYLPYIQNGLNKNIGQPHTKYSDKIKYIFLTDVIQDVVEVGLQVLPG